MPASSPCSRLCPISPHSTMQLVKRGMLGKGSVVLNMTSKMGSLGAMAKAVGFRQRRAGLPHAHPCHVASAQSHCHRSPARPYLQRRQHQRWKLQLSHEQGGPEHCARPWGCRMVARRELSVVPWPAGQFTRTLSPIRVPCSLILAMDQVTKSLALDLASQGIVAYLAHPGWVATRMTGELAYVWCVGRHWHRRHKGCRHVGAAPATVSCMWPSHGPA